MDATAYTDGVLVARRELTADDFTVTPHLRKTLRDKESLSVSQKRSPILSHAPPPRRKFPCLLVLMRVLQMRMGSYLLGYKLDPNRSSNATVSKLCAKKGEGKDTPACFLICPTNRQQC